MKTLTFEQLKKFVSESLDDLEDGYCDWTVEYYSKDTDEYLGSEVVRAKSISDARRKFFEFKRNVVSLDYGKSYPIDDLYVPVNGIYRNRIR